jgi:hypothetical protein
MKLIRNSLCVIMLCCIIPAGWGQAAPAGGGGGAAAGAAGAGRGGAGAVTLNRAFFAGEFDTMAQQLVLSDEQKPKLRDKIDTMNKEIDTFLSNAPAQIAAGRRGARGAAGRGAGAAGRAGGGTNAGTATPNPAIAKLQDDLQLLINEHQVLINQALTPEQRIAWETYKLNRVLDPRLQPLALTDDQKDRIKALVDFAAQSLAALTDGKTVQTLQGQLFRKIIGDVLTDAQASKFVVGTLPVQGGGAARGAGAGAGAAPGAARGAAAGGAVPPATGAVLPEK